MNDGSHEHERVVVDQFTRQAEPFRKFAETPVQPRVYCLEMSMHTAFSRSRM